jgi:hypothetical protein
MLGIVVVGALGLLGEPEGGLQVQHRRFERVLTPTSLQLGLQPNAGSAEA